MSTISAGTTTPTALSLSGDTTGALTFQVNGTTTAATISAAGNFGIGTASPSYRLDTQTATSITQARFSNSATGGATITSTGGSQAIWAGGTEFNGTAFVARATTSSQIRTDSGLVTFFTNDSLTSGNTFTPTERMRLDTSGNVGIGTTAPGNSRLRVQNSSGTFGNSNPLQSWAYANFQVTNLHLDGSVNPVFNTDADSNWNPPATMIWQFRGTERMRITSGGNLGVGQGTPTARLDVLADSGNIVRFINSSVVGVSLSAGSNSFTTLSDERNKTDLVPISDAVSKLKELRTVVGRYNQDDVGVERSFLIAQDVQKVFPPAVDANKPDELGLRYTDMIPLLVAAIKEQQEQIKALQDKVAALETK